MERGILEDLFSDMVRDSDRQKLFVRMSWVHRCLDWRVEVSLLSHN